MMRTAGVFTLAAAGELVAQNKCKTLDAGIQSGKFGQIVERSVPIVTHLRI